MVKKKKQILVPEEYLRSESGTLTGPGPTRIALGYPAPYRVGTSSLGFQTVYRIWNTHPGVTCERFFQTNGPRLVGALSTLETGMQVARADAVAFSVACETELLVVADLLHGAGIAPLAADRGDADPPVIIGGPLTMLDPRLVAPIADVVICGEAESLLPLVADHLVATDGKIAFIDALPSGDRGLWIPLRQDSPPALSHVESDLLPAVAATWSPLSELKDLFLVEIARGCPRACAFCLLSGSAECSGGFRPVAADRILSAIPEGATGVGLVGAAVTDHPDVEDIVARIVETGRRVSLSSIRADKLSRELLAQLAKGGLQTLTVAADGSSARVRRSIHKGITEAHLQTAAEMAREAGLRGLKLYSMVGLPGEEDADLREFADLVLALNRIIKISVAVQAFVPKPNTPLSSAEMAPQSVLKHRLETLRRMLGGRVHFLPTSVRWSWLDWKLAHGAERSAHVAISAGRNGGSFSDWKRAVAEFL